MIHGSLGTYYELSYSAFILKSVGNWKYKVDNLISILQRKLGFGEDKLYVQDYTAGDTKTRLGSQQILTL